MTLPMVAIQSRLQRELRAAMQARHAPAVRALRSLLAALANAEAVPLPPSPGPDVPTAPQPGQPHDVPRRELTETEIAAVVRHEITSLQSTIELLTSRGRPDAAIELTEELRVLQSYL